MKDILVEFTDNGAIIHKDPAKIESRKDLPYCFLNPDLSKVSGISPAYWVCNENKEIVPASVEERQRREEYHQNKSPENKISLEQILNDMQQEVQNTTCDIVEEVKKELNEKIEGLHQLDDQIINTFDAKLILLKNTVDEEINNKVLPSIKVLEEKDVALKSDIPSLDGVYSSLEELKNQQILLVDKINKELCDKITFSEEKIKDDVHSLINDMTLNQNKKHKDIELSLDFIINSYSGFKETANNKIIALEKQLNIYKIALMVSAIIALIGAIK